MKVRELLHALSLLDPEAAVYMDTDMDNITVDIVKDFGTEVWLVAPSRFK